MQHFLAGCGEESDEAPRGWGEAAVFLPNRADVPARSGVAQSDLDQCRICVLRAGQHRDSKAGPDKAAQRFMFFALKREARDETRVLTKVVEQLT